MHILSIPSFFITNRTGQPHGDELGRTKPLSNNASSWVLSSANSCGAILYGRLEIGAVPGRRSTMISTALSGGIVQGVGSLDSFLEDDQGLLGLQQICRSSKVPQHNGYCGSSC